MARLMKKNGEYVLKDIQLSQANDMYLELEPDNAFEVSVRFMDKRRITERQRRFIFALCNEIAYYMGEDAEWVRMLLQNYNAKLRNIDVESLSTTDMTYANGLIDTIINFMIEKEIPFSKKLIDDYGYTFDERQTYSMCLKRVCVVCGSRAEIHHVDSVGMGNNRNKISHVGKRALPLCREHHTECHTIGNANFIEKYHLTPITIDKKMEYFIKKKKLRFFKEDLENGND